MDSVLLFVCSVLWLPGCVEEGIQYDPHAIPISTADSAELQHLDTKLQMKLASAAPEDKGLIELARAEIAFRQNKSDEAIALVQRELQGSPLEIQFLQYFELGKAFLKNDEKIEADNAWKRAIQADPTSPMMANTLKKLALLHVEDDPELAATYLTSALAIGLEDKDEEEEAEVALSQALERAKNPDADQWKKSVELWYPKRFTYKGPKLEKESELLTQAEGFSVAKQYKNAIEAYKVLLKDESDYKRYFWQQIYKAAKKVEDLKLQQDALTQLTGVSAKPEKVIESELQLARFKWNHELAEEAKVILNGLLAKSPNPKARIMLAKIDAEAKDYSSALYQLDKVVQEHPTLPDAEEALFWSAWYLYLSHRFAEAKVQFETYRDRYGKQGNFYEAAFFWGAMSALALGDVDESNRILRRLIKEDAYSFYGLLAQKELGEFPADSIETVPRMKFGRHLLKRAPLLHIEWLKLAEKLLSVGLDEYGLYYLEAALREGVDEDRELPWRVRLYAAQLYMQANKHLKGIKHLQKLKTEKSLPDWVLWLLYPRPYWREVQKAAKDFNLDPYMILAVMRQESAFNPKALSPADAYGLLQLLPSTAAGVAKQIGESSPKDPNLLFDPAINIHLGAAFLRQLLNAFKDRWMLVLASYNASPRIAMKWMNTRWRPEALEFLEEIPYNETRSYVKLVLRNYLAYRALYE
ncbi:MAG TPA: transglycosylase SLT domain-containing protein, partial [Bdellovibrionota bacterium]|nr:transglycosylase SLT domain-containing protein [Bdellovibrionota bacterium]